MVRSRRWSGRPVGTAALLAGVLLSAAGCGASTAQPTSKGGKVLPSIAVMYYPEASFNLYFTVAIDQGYAAEDGIQITPVLVGSGSAAGGAAALAGGSLNLISGVIPSVLSYVAASGTQLKLIAGFATVGTNYLIAGKGYTGPTDSTATYAALEGKKIAISGFGSGGYLIFKAAAQAAGVDPSTMTFVNVGSGGAPMVAALQTGEVQFAVGTATTVAESAVYGTTVAINFGSPSVFPGYSGTPTGGLWVTASYYSSHPFIIAALRKALCQAQQWVSDPSHVTAVEAMIESDLSGRVSTTAVTNFVRATISTEAVFVSEADATKWGQFAYTSGILKQPIPVSSYYAKGTPSSAADAKTIAGESVSKIESQAK